MELGAATRAATGLQQGRNIAGNRAVTRLQQGRNRRAARLQHCCNRGATAPVESNDELNQIEFVHSGGNKIMSLDNEFAKLFHAKPLAKSIHP